MRRMLLIAEGDDELREVYRQYLAARGYGVETAADGLVCLEKLRRLRPAVLVLDRELPWGGGDSVLARLRDQRAPAGTSVVLIATTGCARDVAEDTRPPLVRLLTKPFALAALLESVRAAIPEGEVFVPPAGG
jgi:two-component system OmpR family response regulator